MEKYWIWFKILEIEYEKKIMILDKYRDIKKIYCLSNDELKYEFKFRKQEIDIFMNKNIRKRASCIDKYNKENSISVLNILDEYYPYLLTKIYRPPLILYYKGDKRILNNRSINVFIGRDINEYGKNVLKKLCNVLKENSTNIISRFEKVDKNIYVNNKQNNIIILSNGIRNDVKYENGIILSEYEYDVICSKTNILYRNRILTGIANETIILQANVIDGVSYIVDIALDQNREVLVIPGNIFDDNNTFTNELIKEGAKVITNLNELLVYEHEKNMLTE